MSIRLIETTLTVFCTFTNLDQIVPDISSIIPESFERTSFMEKSSINMEYQAYSFRDKKSALVLRPNRIDFAFNTSMSNEDAFDIFHKYLNDMNCIHTLHITRLALNSSSYLEDNDYALLKKFVSNINLRKYNIKNEFSIRFNSVEKLFNTEVNNTTVIRTAILTNNSTFKKINAIVVNKDINTSITQNNYKFTNIEETIEHFSDLVNLHDEDKNTVYELILGDKL